MKEKIELTKNQWKSIGRNLGFINDNILYNKEKSTQIKELITKLKNVVITVTKNRLSYRLCSRFLINSIKKLT